jgi:hypothetical protein
MRVNINHPTFVAFIDTVTTNVSTNIDTTNYFTVPQEKKVGVWYIALKLIRLSAKRRAKFSETELQDLIKVILKRCEDNEEYEFAAIMKDLLKNYDSVSSLTRSPVRQSRKSKTEATSPEKTNGI